MEVFLVRKVLAQQSCARKYSGLWQDGLLKNVLASIGQMDQKQKQRIGQLSPSANISFDGPQFRCEPLQIEL